MFREVHIIRFHPIRVICIALLRGVCSEDQHMLLSRFDRYIKMLCGLLTIFPLLSSQSSTSFVVGFKERSKGGIHQDVTIVFRKMLGVL
jgi:hypothetical protein